MHPILADRKKVAVYLAVWFLAGLFLSALFVPKLEWPKAVILSIPMSLVYGFMNLASWYPNRRLRLEESGFLRIFIVNLLAAFVSSLAWMVVGRIIALIVFSILGFGELVQHYDDTVPILFGIGILLYLLSAAVQFLVMTFEASREVERRAFELKLLAQDAELKALRAQIDPHFLFNSLNSISALTTQNPSAARDMCILLGDFLRKSLKVGSKERIPLEEEIALIKNFLAIEKVRFGDRLDVHIFVDQASVSASIPPLLLQPLIENAIKHGIAQRIDGGAIELTSQQSGSILHVKIRNPVDFDKKNVVGNKIGLQNVKDRLRKLYGGDARIETEQANGFFVVDLSLPAGKMKA
ncbi:MAG: histidine kinase [Ignavibacteriales bacterium]|nr:histidine kinase [Ignavibacteriales bacterium]